MTTVTPWRTTLIISRIALMFRTGRAIIVISPLIPGFSTLIMLRTPCETMDRNCFRSHLQFARLVLNRHACAHVFAHVISVIYVRQKKRLFGPKQPLRRYMRRWLYLGTQFPESTSPFSMAQRTICARLVTSNFDRMLAMCFSTVRLLTTSSPAISVLDLPI